MNFTEQHDWPGNFRELNAIITRMATLAPGGRIDLPTVQKEIATCTSTPLYSDDDNLLIEALGKDYTKDYDYFELIQLREVIKVCRESKNRSEAGRKLYSVSRLARKTKNDADRLGNYLKRFNLNFPELKKL